MKDLMNNYLKKSNVVIDFDIDKKNIKYDLIKQHREIKSITGEEEIVRAFLLERLVKDLGYSTSNIEIEKEYDIGRPQCKKPRIDIIVKNQNSNDVFLYIELKSPQEYEKDKDEWIEKQLFNLASQEKGEGNNVKYLVLYTFETTQDEIKDKCIIIDYEKFNSFNSWKEQRNFADEIPVRYGKAQKEPYIKNGKKELEKEFTQCFMGRWRN